MIYDVDVNRIQWWGGKHIRTAWFWGIFLKLNSQKRVKLLLILSCQFPNTNPPSAGSLGYQVHELTPQRHHGFTEPRTGNKKFSPPHPTTRKMSRISLPEDTDFLKRKRSRSSSSNSSVFPGQESSIRLETPLHHCCVSTSP